MENALETMSTTNDKIQNLIDQFEKDSGVRVDQLSMVLNGVVDAAVNGGIANYKVKREYIIKRIIPERFLPK